MSACKLSSTNIHCIYLYKLITELFCANEMKGTVEVNVLVLSSSTESLSLPA